MDITLLPEVHSSSVSVLRSTLLLLESTSSHSVSKASTIHSKTSTASSVQKPTSQASRAFLTNCAQQVLMIRHLIPSQLTELNPTSSTSTSTVLNTRVLQRTRSMLPAMNLKAILLLLVHVLVLSITKTELQPAPTSQKKKSLKLTTQPAYLTQRIFLNQNSMRQPVPCSVMTSPTILMVLSVSMSLLLTLSATLVSMTTVQTLKTTTATSLCSS